MRALTQTASLYSLDDILLAQYLADISNHPILTQQQEQDLSRRYRDKNDQEALNRLMMSNLRLVAKVACDYKDYGFRLLDLIQEGNTGLIVAVKRFNPSKNCRLFTFAAWWIRTYMQAFIMRGWSSVKMAAIESRQQNDMLPNGGS